MHVVNKHHDNQKLSFSEQMEQEVQIIQPKFYKEQNFWRTYVPRNNNCLFLSAILAYLLPTKNGRRELEDRLDNLFSSCDVQFSDI